MRNVQRTAGAAALAGGRGRERRRARAGGAPTDPCDQGERQPALTHPAGDEMTALPRAIGAASGCI